jgi:hypothetical protein
VNPPESVLLEFMREMNEWEKRCALRTAQCDAGEADFDEAVRLGQSEYTSIFQKYCSQAKARPRDFFYMEPPDYDPEGEGIVAIKRITEELAEIRTRQNYVHQKNQLYKMIRENCEWMIYEKFIITDNDELIESSL